MTAHYKRERGSDEAPAWASCANIPLMQTHLLGAYLPTDRWHALARGAALPEHTRGAALFADVSGFTPLTEALLNELGARRGAEELTRQLNLVYDALIAEVDRYGGSVLTFSGDAITCWFDGDAGARAIACGLAMQTAMRQFSAVLTPSGKTVALAMKAAIAAGPVRRFVVGDPDIQLIDALAGETLERMAEAEHHAERGEVVASAEAVTEDMRVREWRAEAESHARFAVIDTLAAPVAPHPWPALTATLTEAQVKPWLLPAVYERARAGQADFLAELRPAFALFVRFRGLDYDDDLAAGEKLDRFIRWAQAILHRHASAILQLTIGDKGSYFYAAFGAPLAYDDDAERAVAAALELRQPPAEMDFITSIQLGLSQGRMRVGPYGSDTRRTYGVLGDPVNLAARLMGRAESGEVLINHSVAEAVRQHYQIESLGLIQLKGKAEPLPAFRVSGRRQLSQQRALALFTAPLVGRAAELQMLDDALTRALAGRGQMVRIEGGPGVGKSHLAAEFAARAARRGARVLVGQCQSMRQDSAYAVWRAIFRARLALTEEAETAPNLAAHITAQLTDINPTWDVRAPLLGDLLDVPIPDNATTAAFDARLRREALLALALDLLRHWAQAQPLLLLIEDAHWMDEASQDLTLALGRVLQQFPALVLLTQRPPASASAPILPELNRLPHTRALPLAELSLEGIAQLVGHRLQGPPDVLALSLIQTRAQGNPFFAEELVDNLRELQHLVRRADGGWEVSEALITALREANGLVKDADGQWQLAPHAPLSAISLPDSVQGMVLARMDRLPEAHKDTLKVASVIGRNFELEVLNAAHPTQPETAQLEQQMEMLDERDFTRREQPPPHAAYIFRHNATHEVAYDTLLEAQQRELHRAVGNVLERFQPEAVEQLAYHFSRGGPAARAQALTYLERAARKAQREYANETALNYYAQALALEERWEWRKGQVEILHILGRRAEEQTALRGLEAAPAAPALVVADAWGQYYEAVGDYAQAQAAVEQARAAAQAQADAVGEIHSIAQLGLIARRQGDYDTAKNRYLQALGLYHQRALPAEAAAQAHVQILNGLGIVQRQLGDFDQARACYEEALTLSRANGDRRGEAEALNSLGVTAYYQRHFTEAVRYHQQALDLRRAIGDRAGEGTSDYNLALAIQEMGDYVQARAHFTSALAIQQATGNRWEEVNLWNVLGILYHQLGAFDEARTQLQQGLRLSREIGDEAGQAYLLANLGLVARDTGEGTTAVAQFNEGLAIAQKQDDKYLVSYFLSHLGIVELQLGQATAAVEHAQAALALRREVGLRLWLTADLTTLAAAQLALKDSAAALDYAQQALAILDECHGEGPECPQQDYWVCYQVLAALGQREAAHTALRAAQTLVQQRAEKITDPALRASFLNNVPVHQAIAQAAA